MERQGRNNTRKNNLRNNMNLGRNNNRSNNNRSNNNRSLRPDSIENTVTNENSNSNSNFNSNSNYNNEPRGKRYYTAEDQLMDAISETEALPVSEVIHRIKNILEKIATRPAGNERYPKNKLQIITINQAIAKAIQNPDARIYRRHSMSVAILDTLLSHRLFKNVTKQDPFGHGLIPYDVVNEALSIASRMTEKIDAITYLIDHGASPTFQIFTPLVGVLRKHTAESDAIAAVMMQHPDMQHMETLQWAIESTKRSSIYKEDKEHIISFCVHYMIPLLEDTSDKKTIDAILIIHDQYREFMAPADVEKINKLYATVLRSINTSLPPNVHGLLSTYGGKRTRKHRKYRKH